MATFYNQATMTYNGTAILSNVTSGELVEDLTITKTAVNPTYVQQGDSVTFAISIVNAGTTAYTNLTLEDNLGAYTFGTNLLLPMEYTDPSISYYVNGVAQAVPAVQTSTTGMTVTGISVPAGGNALILYEARTNGYAPLGENGKINNVATLSGTGLAEPPAADETVETTLLPQLTITKSLSPAVVTDTGETTYTFLIQNTGGAAVATTDPLTVTDTFLPVLSNVTAAFNGTAWTEGTQYSYNTASGLFTTTQGALSVPAATYAQDITTGEYAVTPGTAVLTVTGTIG